MITMLIDALVPLIPQPEWGWTIKDKLVHTPWRNVDHRGVRFEQGENVITPLIVNWFKDRGWIVDVSDRGWIYIAPFECLPPPRFLYHITPEANGESIRLRGLLTGQEAGRSTTNRRSCRNAIYVSLTEQAARKWAQGSLLGKLHLSSTWIIFRIDSAGLTKSIYRDPASQTGYILEDTSVSNTYLDVRDTFLIEESAETIAGTDDAQERS
jgi:hypothetical protein